MVDLQTDREDGPCKNAMRDSRKVPIDIWVQKTKPVVEKLGFLHQEGKIEYAAFGATALGALGYIRPTKDVDLVIRPKTWSFDQTAHAITGEFGFTHCPRSTQKVQMLVKEIGGFYFVVELWENYIYVMDCDDAMWSRIQLGQNLGFPAFTLSTEDLISSKLGRYFFEHAQEDITDIAFLLREHGITDYPYFVQRIGKIRRNKKTIDDFLFEEMLALEKIIGPTPITELHSEIVRRRPYRQLLERIVFQIAPKTKTIEKIAKKALLLQNDMELLLEKLEITKSKNGFKIPENPNAAITRSLSGKP